MRIRNSAKGNFKYVTVCLWILLGVQLSLIIFSNFTMIDKLIDCDSAKLMTHIMRRWEEKELVIPNWNFLSTLELDCTALFAIFFYGITGNIFVSCAISNTILMGGLLAAIFLLFRKKDILYSLLCANLIFIPYRVGMLDYYNMLFFAGAQYIVKVTVPVLLIGILLAMEQEKRNPWGFIIFYFLYLGVTSISSGIYVSVCGVLPILIVYLGYKFLRWEKISKSIILLMTGSVGIAFIGAAANNHVMGGARGDSMVLASIYVMRDNVASCFFGLFEVLGGVMPPLDTKVFSVMGITFLMKLFLTVLLLVCCVIALRQCVKGKGKLDILLLLSVVIGNLVILCITWVRAGSSTYEYRYHLIGIIPLFCLTGIVLLDWIGTKNCSQQNVLFIMGLLGIFSISLVSFKDLFSMGELHGDLRELCAYLEDDYVEIVYLYESDSDSEICRVFDDTKKYLCLHENGLTTAYGYYLDYMDAPMQTDEVVVVSYGDCGEIIDIAGNRFVRRDHIGERYLYFYDD